MVKELDHCTYSDALMIGIAQVCAIIPGASRSGVTMTMARALGYDRVEAARFAMLLSIPTILGLGAATALKLYLAGDVSVQHDAVIAAGLSAVTAFLSIAFMMALIRRASFTPFVVYRLALSAALFAVLYGG